VDKFLKYPGEHIDDLLCKGLKIIQHQNSYRFAIDAVLLANFVKAGKRDRIMDLGTGSGVIALLLSAKTDAKEIIGIELVEAAFDRAVRSVKMNKLKERVRIVHSNLNEAVNIFGRQSFSVVVTNPPYMTVKEGKISPNPDIALAKHEVAATLQDVVKAAWELLTFGGRFYMVYRTVRLADAIYEMKARGLEPKILRFIQPRAGDSPNIVLVMAKKGAGPGLKILPPLVVYDKDGSYTDEIKEIYFGKTTGGLK
jgi:tRNA1Val (adenine37-N6)-methyltransferase